MRPPGAPDFMTRNTAVINLISTSSTNAEGPTMSREPVRIDRRRAQFARRFGALEAMEGRSLVSESLGILTAGIGVPAALIARAEAANSARAARPPRRPATTTDAAPNRPVAATPPPSRGTNSAPASTTPLPAPPVGAAPSLDLAPAANAITVKSIAAPADSSKGGGAGGTSHGGSGSVAPAAAAPGSTAAPAPSTPGAATAPSVVLPATLDNPATPPNPTASTASHVVVEPAANASPSAVKSIGGAARPAAMTSFANFPLYTLDYDAGSVFPPGTERLATLGGNMDLRAQVEDTTVSSYSWDTSGLTDATAISGAGTYDLTFQWDASVPAAATNSATLTVTNTAGQAEVQTYNFQVPAGSGTAGTGTASWPQSLGPDTVGASAPAFAAHSASVDANSGTLDTSITLPTYNPNVPAVVLSYDSTTANPLPIVTAPHALDPAQAVPSQVTAQLTFDGSTGSSFDYDTSQLTPGDIQQVALQADASSLPTGRYPYSVSIGDVRGATTTTTLAGSTTVVNDSTSALGSGWVVDGLEKVVPAAGGVVLDLGSAGQSLWFANGSGSTYVDPAGEFSALVANGDGSFTRTLTDGTTIQFDPAGQETAELDRNGVGLAYSHDGSGRLSTIQDHYGNTTTFSYDGSTGLLDSITDPAGRTTTFAHSGSALSGVTLPDNSTWDYASDGPGQVTRITDPDSNSVAVAYDAAGRVGTITNPDATSESFTPAQEQGFVPAGSGTQGSPAAPTLLAQAGATYTDPLGNVTNLYPDWQGLGLTDVTSDPLGNVTTAGRDGNGLATVVVDPLDRITQYTYDSQGNVTGTINPDGSTTSATYNGLAEPLTTTDELGRTTTSAYDNHGNRTSLTDPLGNVTTDSYTPTGQVGSQGDPSTSGTQSFLTTQQIQEMSVNAYNPQDERTSTQDPDGHVTTTSFDSAGEVTSVTDPNDHTTSATYDAMGRVLTTTDALDQTTSDQYDADGNKTVVTDPLGHATTTAYDAMDRVKAVTDADGGVTTYAYDADGRLASITDSVGNTTSYAYDADGRQTSTTDPNGYVSTKTYDADGEVITSVDADGRQTNYGYDARGRQVSEAWIGAGGSTVETIATAYDAAGQTTSITDGTTTLASTYDLDGRQLTASTSGTAAGQPSVTLTSSYAPDGSRVGLADDLSSAGATASTYDAADRLTNLAASYGGAGGPQVALGYDPAGNLTAITRTDNATSGGGSGNANAGGGSGGLQTNGAGGVGGTGPGGGGGSSSATIVTNLAYDAADRVTGITDQVAGGATLDAQTYGYDAADRLTAETNAEGSATYAYDNINQLIGVTGAAAAAYSYDANGNRTMAGYATATGNETTSGAGYTYTYDQDGNLTSMTQASTGDVWAYTWDYRNRLTAAVETAPGGAVLAQSSYTYDPLDRRIGVDETVAGAETKTSTVYDGVNAYADFDGSGALLVRYLDGPGADQVLARTSASGATAWYLADHEGSIRDLVSTTGAVIDHVAYDAYGDVTSETSPSSGDRFKFDGMAWDAAIDLYYDNARYYDPATGKFISQDPLGFSAEDANISRFVENDPTDFTDPSGKIIPLLVIGGIGAWELLAGGLIIGGGAVSVGLATGTLTPPRLPSLPNISIPNPFPILIAKEIQEVTIVPGKGVQIGGPIDFAGAVAAAGAGGDILAPDKSTAQAIAGAAGNGPPQWDPPHAPGQKPHYHPVRNGVRVPGSHVLY